MSAKEEWRAWPGEWREYAVRLRARTYKEALLLACRLFGEYEPESIHVERVTADERLAESAPEMLELLELLAEETPCRKDHHGHCQEHGWTEASPCPHSRARAVIAKAKGGEYESDSIHVERVTADGRLAEAAPELLAVAEDCVRFNFCTCSSGQFDPCITCRARAAIAKAKGETP